MKFLVVCLLAEAGLPKSYTDLIGGARSLALPDGRVEAVVLGCDGASCRDAAISGADRIYAVDRSVLGDYDPEVFLQALEQVSRLAEPTAVLFVAGQRESELAPRLAHRLGTGAVTECVGLRVIEEGKRLLFTRPVFGGRLMADMSVSAAPCVATLAPGSLEPLILQDGVAEIQEVKYVAPTTRRVRALGVERSDTEGVPLEGARIVVSAGRGLGDPANWHYVEELAETLGAAIGVSRAAVDAGWAPPGRQVGQTGKSVAPDLYIAIGISGATQHLAGVRGAKHIVVVNTDSEAPFYRFAEVGVAMDYGLLLPPLMARLRDALEDTPLGE